MSGSGGEPAEIKEDLGTYVDNLGKGCGKSKGAKDVFKDIDSCVTDFWGGDVGDEPLRGPGPGGF